MIQSKYCSVKTHFGSYRGTECHFPRIKCCFCWRWWIFVRRVFHCVDVILRANILRVYVNANYMGFGRHFA